MSFARRSYRFSRSRLAMRWASGRACPGTAARVDLGLLEPVAQRLGADAELAGNSGHDPEGLTPLLGDGITGHARRPLSQALGGRLFWAG